MGWANYTKYLFVVCLLAGRAAAAAGFYLFGVLVPALTNQPFVARRWGLLIGICLLTAYLTFPLVDLLHWYLEAPVDGIQLWDTEFYRSQFSSAVGITGLLCLIYCVVLSHDGIPARIDPVSIRTYSNGFLWAGVLLFMYALVQLTTGFNFSEVADQRTDRLMAFGLFRVPGFTGHPVHFAGQCLPIFGFFWARTWRARPKMQRSDIINAGIFFVLIWFSGSRMGALVALITLILIPWLHGGLSWARRMGIIGLAAALGVILTYVTGMFARIFESFDHDQYSGLGNRLQFWRVHWQMFLDSPWIGWGHIWSDLHWRQAYYQKLGLGTFPEQYNAHNVFLEILANCGLIGLLALGISFLGCLIAVRRIFTSEMSVPLVWAFVTLAIFGLTQNSFFDTPAQLILLGLLASCIWSHQPDLVNEKES